MPVHTPLLQKTSLERLERLTINWKKSFKGLLGGSNVSRYSGVGHDFLDHRHFQSGDSLRSVNWRAYLRLERIFIKMFCTEPRTPIRLLLDCSGSMACGVSESKVDESKFTYACRLTAALCFIALLRLETIFTQPFSDGLKTGFKVDGGRHRYALVENYLSGLSASGTSNFFESVRHFLAPEPSPGLIIIVSDFFDENGCDEALRHLADFGHELLLLHVAGPDDKNPPWRGECELIDVETGVARRLNIDEKLAAEYTTTYEEYCRRLEYSALRGHGRYIHLPTEISVENSLSGAMYDARLIGLR